MINILATSNYKITKETYGKVHYDGYRELTELCVKSFCKNIIEGVDEVYLLGNDGKEFESYHEMNKYIYRSIQRRYFLEECNILYVDSDTICVKPILIWGLWDIFRMFVIKNEFRSAFPANVPRELYQNIPQWFMSNVRYYPAGISEKVWKTGDEFYNNWLNVWAYECIIYNHMFYAQYIDDPLKYNDELMNFQYVPGQTNFDLIDQAKIIHVQATRGIDEAIKRTKDMLNEI